MYMMEDSPEEILRNKLVGYDQNMIEDTITLVKENSNFQDVQKKWKSGFHIQPTYIQQYINDYYNTTSSIIKDDEVGSPFHHGYGKRKSRRNKKNSKSRKNRRKSRKNRRKSSRRR
jgi:hypothetical protein